LKKAYGFEINEVRDAVRKYNELEADDAASR